MKHLFFSLLQIFLSPSFLDPIMSYRKMDKHGSPQYCRHFLADNSIFHGRFMSVWWIYRNVPLLYRTIWELGILHFSKSQEMWRVVFDYLTIKCIWDWYTQGGAVSHIMMIIKRWCWIVWELPSSVLKGKEISPSWLDAVRLSPQVHIAATKLTAWQKYYNSIYYK